MGEYHVQPPSISDFPQGLDSCLGLGDYFITLVNLTSVRLILIKAGFSSRFKSFYWKVLNTHYVKANIC